MSNKKSNIKKETANQTVQKPTKGIIIAVVAVLVAVAAAVAIYFIANKEDKPKKPDVGTVVTLDSNGSEYTFAEYKGTKMPVEFVEILNKAELDSYNLCEKDGVTLNIGDRSISVQEFVMYYYDIYYFQSQAAVYSIQQTGGNRTGFDLQTLPRDQKHMKENYTWSEQFTLNVIESITNNYMMFDKAVEAGIEISNSAIAEVFDIIDMVERGAKKEKWTPDEELADTYCEGITDDMYYAREIMVRYAMAYEEAKFNEFSKSYSAESVKATLNKNPDKYSVVKARVYPIEGEYNEAEVAAVKTKEEFLAYANKNHPRDTYDAEYSTDCGYITKEKISSVYGEEVGNWTFAKDRKAGDIALVEGALFRYLVYIEVPAFYATSCDVMFVGTQYDETMSKEDIEKIFKENEEKYLKWKNEDGTKEGFWDYSTGAGGAGEQTVRIGNYQFEIDNWIFDAERKSGDHAMLNLSGGCCAIYFIGKNANDYDWEENVRSDKANADIQSMCTEAIEKDYEAKRKSDVLEKAYDAADISIGKHIKKIEKEAEENNISLK